MNPQILPVIHYKNLDLALKNADIVARAGCPGLFLIEMNGNNEPLDRAAKKIRAEWPHMRIGINRLDADPVSAVQHHIDTNIDMTWTDQQLTHSQVGNWNAVEHLRETIRKAQHQLFSGVAFKYQAYEPDPATAARSAIEYGLIPTTSGPGTGMPADTQAIAGLRKAIGPKAPLAIASGITPENVASYASYLSHILVATGIASDFYNLDAERLKSLKNQIEKPAVAP